MQSTPPHERLIHIFRWHKWHTLKAQIENKSCSVKWNGFFYACTDVSTLVGVPALMFKTDEQIIVFDFSASHLCPRQLEKIKNEVIP